MEPYLVILIGAFSVLKVNLFILNEVILFENCINYFNITVNVRQILLNAQKQTCHFSRKLGEPTRLTWSKLG